MIDYLASFPEVQWCLELYGQYQYFMSLRTKRVMHVGPVLKEFHTTFWRLVTARPGRICRLESLLWLHGSRIRAMGLE
jgi:DNA-binding Lrp family transcriptional regulator